MLCALGGVAYMVFGKGFGAEPDALPVRDADVRAEKMPIKIEPAKISMGVHSPCDPPLRSVVKITNQSDKPFTIKRINATCACTSAEIEGSRTLAPGESRDMTINVDLSGIGDKSQGLYLIQSGQPGGYVRVDYTIVPPVKPTVEAVDLNEETSTAEVGVVREDGKPVKLLRLEPEIGYIKDNPDGTQVVIVDRARADAYAESAAGRADSSVQRDASRLYTGVYMAVVTDYPTCPNASVLVRRGR